MPIPKLDMWDQIKVMALVLKYFDIIGPSNFKKVVHCYGIANKDEIRYLRRATWVHLCW